MLDVGEINGKRRRLFFEKQEDAEAAMARHKLILKRNGEDALALPVPEILEFRAAKDRLERMQPPATIMEAVLALEQDRKKFTPKSLADAVTACVAAKVEAGNRDIYTKTLKRTLMTMAHDHPGLKVNEITAEQVSAWARKPRRPDHPVSLDTVKGRLIDAHTLFNFCLKRKPKWITENPCKAIEPVQLEEKPRGIHTLEQVKLLLCAALEHDRGALGYIAPIYFGGLRPNEAKTLDKAQVHENDIEIQGPKAKGRKARFVPINPTLRAWITIKGVEFGMSPRSRRIGRLRRIIKKETGKPFPWPHDVLRHSFCSYGVPKYGATKIAAWSAHHEQVLFRRYRDKVKESEAEAFWAITPALVKNICKARRKGVSHRQHAESKVKK